MSLVEPAEWRCVTCGREYVEREAGDVCPEDDTVLVPRSTAERFAGDAFLGRRFADDFLIFDILGLGGFGAVYRAVEPAAGRQVAIKTIRPGAERHNADARARFAQEARLLRQLDNPHIVRVLRSGETADGLYMALELVPGRSLKRVMRSHTALSPRRVVHITEQILDALCHAHAMGLIHRDLKPANVLVVERADDAVKVIDFGIAKVLEADDEDEGPKTGTGLVLGTVRYMAPEQLRQGGVVGPASDLYAVGIMFYEMLTGKAPFDGSQAEIAAAHLYQPAPPLPEGVAPDSVRDWLARVLRKEPTDRFSDAKATRAALIAAMPADETAEDLTIPVRPDLGGPLAEADRETSGPLSSGVSGMVSGSLDTSGQGVVRLVTPEDGAADPTDGPVAAPRDGSTLPGHQPRGMAPPVPQARSTIESPAPVESFTAALADLPDLDPGLIPRPGESSGTIQQTLGELGLAPPGEGRRRRWLAPAVVALVLLGVVLFALRPDAPEAGGADAEVTRISLSVTFDARPAVAAVDAAMAQDAARAAPPVDAAAPDAQVMVEAPRPRPPPPRRPAMSWRAVQKAEDEVSDALDRCRCTQARRLIEGLPTAFPGDRRRRLGRRLDACRVPLVDQRCVDGKVL